MFYPAIYRTNATSLFDDLLGMRREFDRALGGSQWLQAWTPVVDVKETPDALQVVAELPGLSPSDVNVTVQDGVLTISGEKKTEYAEGKESTGYHLFERRYGQFERSFTLPRTVIADDVRADFASGLLTITLPKTDDAKPRRIQVEVKEKALQKA